MFLAKKITDLLRIYIIDVFGMYRRINLYKEKQTQVSVWLLQQVSGSDKPFSKVSLAVS